MERLRTSNALEALAGVEAPFVELFKHGSLSIEVYKPERVDLQEPHDQDEVYVVIAGSGMFVNGETAMWINSSAYFGGFVNDGATSGKRRGDLPRRQHERRIPRRDHAHWPNWYPRSYVH